MALYKFIIYMIVCKFNLGKKKVTNSKISNFALMVYGLLKSINYLQTEPGEKTGAMRKLARVFAVKSSLKPQFLWFNQDI